MKIKTKVRFCSTFIIFKFKFPKSIIKIELEDNKKVENS